MILGSEYGGMSLSLAILDENYKPLENLTWLRYAEQIDGKVTNHRSFNPIFETFNAYAEKKPSPDEHYFRNILQIYNGYAKEAVQELEKLQSSQGLSILETLSLTDALARNGETELSIEYLNQIHEKTSTPLTDHRWISQTIDDYEAAINAFSELREHYPGRADLELTASLKPLLNNETKTLFENLETCKKKYPDYVAVYDLLSKMYLEYLDDPESAYDEFKEYCERAKSGYRYLSEASDYFIRMRNYEKALKKAYEAYEYYPFSEGALSQLMYSSKLARKEKELIPLFKELIEKFPYNIDNHSRLFFIYENAGMFDEAQRIMEEIHYIKPSAVMPHQRIDSLHNGIDYDSIFGSIDAMDFWDREPSEEDQGNNNIWSLIDRQQTIVFESGLVFKDYHSGYVLTDQAAVESMQEFNFGFDPSDGFNTLISARRLRKGQPPLSGEVLGSYVVFKDLKPGDAIEFHYRRWSQNSGELWQHFWKSYLVNASYYQRYMEFTILTNRDDLIYYADSIAGEPTTHDTYCGFRRISWKRENLSARKLDLEVLPPQDDILGKIFVSTLPGWNVFNRWYKSISDAILYDNPRSKKLALELTADMESDFNKMSALYEHIVEDIPYQQIGFDYDASIPQKPDQVLVNGWGDCKDKSHLLIK
ncbi:MAG: hypothetical protein GWN00_33610, partial [Aliifodinibius sp.]|nr:hypothetical protein [candidate division Zixibacteria bacterium]NIT60967.1 hypothetical protein [Fodinibius sp.]NIW42449.1 hypothetical protein [candidate division Zixibacteria bacterium]NIX58935.1 hypothetical protein [candidate division Zixibacteria bacterium]NIY29548.1 hypothetical protein [Fodinibius sp.]